MGIPSIAQLQGETLINKEFLARLPTLTGLELSPYSLEAPP